MFKFSRVAKVGVELEGGWTNRPPAWDRCVRDGSIRLEVGTESDSGEVIEYVGEIPSPTFTSQSALFSWMRVNYPEHTNRSCGMHVHVSFVRPTSYVRIMDKTFFDAVQKHLLDWGRTNNLPATDEFFKRLRGENYFCKPDYKPMKQVKWEDKGPSRYSMLNYCFGRYKTVELRVLPLFVDQHIAIQAVETYLDFVETWLSAPPITLKKLTAKVDVEETPDVLLGVEERNIRPKHNEGTETRLISII